MAEALLAPTAPRSDAMERDEILSKLVDSPHVPVPADFSCADGLTAPCGMLEGDLGLPCGVMPLPKIVGGWLTFMNFGWTTTVEIVGQPAENAVTISYARPVNGVDYKWGVERSADGKTVKVFSKIGNHVKPNPTYTQFTKGPEGEIRMRFVRYGSFAEVILAGPGSVDEAKAKELSSFSGASLAGITALQWAIWPCAGCMRAVDFYDNTRRIQNCLKGKGFT